MVNARTNSVLLRHDRPMQPKDSASESRPYNYNSSIAPHSHWLQSAIEKEAELFDGLDSVCKDHDAMRSRIEFNLRGTAVRGDEGN